MDEALTRLRRVLQLGSVGTWDWDMIAGTVVWDHGHHVLMGVPESGPAPTSELYFSLVHPDDLHRIQAEFDRAVEERREWNSEYRIRRLNDGAVRWIESRCVFGYNGDVVRRASGIILDITDRHALQEAFDDRLRERARYAEQFAALFERNPAPMYVFDRGTLRILAANEAMVVHLGASREELLSMSILDICPAFDTQQLPADFDQVLAAPQVEVQVQHRRRNGAIRTMHITGTDVDWEGHAARLVIARDDTERLALEQRVRSAEKMEAIGQLAGGVAHDFNNLLTVVLATTELARARAAVDPALDADFHEIERAAQRGRALVTQLLAFGRRQVVQLRSVSLTDVVQRTEPQMRRLLGDGVALAFNLPDHLPAVEADAEKLEQALVNLAANARDAMTPTGQALPRGTFSMTAYAVEHASADADRWPGLAVGPCLELEVRDTGHGMSAEALARAFEPFYTTKPFGSATGLGLSSVLGIVQQCGGAIVVESVVGRGTAFRLRFPARGTVTARQLTGSHAAVPGGSGTVLLAEDEPSVRTAVRRMLQQMGYRVIEAPDGAVALATWRAHARDIDVLVTDVRMPRMGGPELVHAIRAEAPGFPVVFASGFAGEGLEEPTAADRFLEKPFTSARLKDALDAVLNRAAS